METYFNHFSIKELFKNCSFDEIVSCVRTNSFEGLLTLLQFLDGFREFIKFPIIINSSFRDNAHNIKVGGVPTSQHLLGQAIDFSVPDMHIDSLSLFLHEYLEVCTLSRFIGQVIIYDSFIHIGLRTGKFKSLSIYDKRKAKKSAKFDLHYNKCDSCCDL